MNIVLVNPPNCGRSIPEEEYGITSLKMIFRGEPLALSVLAGNLAGHEVRIVDLKAEPEGMEKLAADGGPDLVGFTAVTCEANTVIRLAGEIKKRFAGKSPIVVVGGHHASCDPAYFNREGIDYIVMGLGKLSFRLLVDDLAAGRTPAIPGVVRVRQGGVFSPSLRKYSEADLVDELPPRYDLVEAHRDKYVMSGVGGKVGFVVTAFGCTHCCAFCSIPSLTDGRYLGHSAEAILRDIDLLGDIPLIRFVDANTFGDRAAARMLATRIIELSLGKKFVADVRADTVVADPDLLRLWHEAGLSAVVIGFEEIDDGRLDRMNKRSSLAKNLTALSILAEIGIRVIGDFIISPDYDREDFERLGRFIDSSPIALPIPSILTPIPGTPLFRQLQQEITLTDLDYYTFSNAVLPTRLAPKEFYTLYSDLMKQLHHHIKKS
ncbi:MAG: B12-binding domain-containing radical SAM protein [Desulfobacterales bacterium GWB2_56_26]|nr:MAG: B12-binding domain-containing radical SAM protein [Desulfobacterales bacterium GWB2_56_26]